jgi:hypothetical protein
MRYLIRHVGLLPAFLFGGLLGLIMSILPAILLGYAFVAAAVRVVEWLGRLAFEVPLPLNQSFAVDLVELAQLDGVRQAVSGIAAGGWTMVATFAITFVLFCGLGGALAGLIGALLFNLIARLTGGIEVSAEAVVTPIGVAEVSLPPAESAPLLPSSVLASTEPPKTASLVTTHSAWLERADDPKQRWALSTGVTRIGSAEDNDVVIKGLMPHHAEIHYESLRYFAIPVEGPVRVNGASVTARHSLRNNIRLGLGEIELIFHPPAGN